MKYSLVVAYDLEKGIGRDGKIPWNLPSDRKRFKEITSLIDSAIVMGKKTWVSLPNRPLLGRINIVLSSSNLIIEDNVYQAHSYDELDILLSKLNISHTFFIGGTAIYQGALNRYKISVIHITEIFADFSCDTFFPKINIDTSKITESEIYYENGLSYRYFTYAINMEFSIDEESFYLMTLNDVLKRGKYRSDRTGVGTLALFGKNYLTFDLRRSFPLLTTKKVFWRGVAEELFFFLRGDTNNGHLLERKIGIWSGNSSREYLDKIGLHNRTEGDLGPVYGWQWRHFGAEYKDCNTDYTNEGYDQIAEVVKELKTNRSSRRIMFSAWNPNDLKQMCLPPCHVLYQFDVEEDELSCCMYQRSADLFLGVPFNIASTALLTHLLAKSCDLNVGDITIYYGNAHIYVNHIEQIKEQIDRLPYPFPKLEIREKKDIDKYTFEDLLLSNYKHHPAIKATMAI